MKRFLITSGLFFAALIALASGVNAALDRAESSPSMSSVALCNEHGTVVFAYNGNLENCRASIKPVPAPEVHFIHRT